MSKITYKKLKHISPSLRKICQGISDIEIVCLKTRELLADVYIFMLVILPLNYIKSYIYG